MKRLLLILILNSTFFIVNCFGQQYGWIKIDTISIPGTPDFSDLYFTGDNTGWISSSSINNVFKTTDGGLTFTTQNTTLTTNAIHMLNATEGYCGGASGFVYRTTDGGANWNFHGTIANTFIDITFPPQPADTGYACGFNGTIYSVTSAGVTVMTSGVISHMASISFPVTSNEGWVCGESIIRHFTGGARVADQVNITGTWNAIYFLNNQNGWAVGDYGKIIHTIDGKNWSTQVNPDLQNRSLFDVFFLNANEGWATGIDGIILHTTDGGINWNVEASGLTTAFLTGVQFTTSTNGYIVGQGKTLLKYTQLTDVEEQPTQHFEFKLEQNYPNPFNPITNIQFRISNFEFVSLKVFDVLGNEVVTLVNEYKPAGEYEVEFSASSGSSFRLVRNLSSGIYLYQLRIRDPEINSPQGQAGQGIIQTKKMILLR